MSTKILFLEVYEIQSVSRVSAFEKTKNSKEITGWCRKTLDSQDFEIIDRNHES